MLYTHASRTVRTVLAVQALVAPLAIMVVAAPVQADDIGATVRSKQWPLVPLGVAEAWQRTRGENVVVAVLDTGVDASHPDLAGAVTGGTDLTGTRGRRPGGDATARPWRASSPGADTARTTPGA
ncbi:S8 family serine peptidase [Streptosporangium lutulentum]